MIQIDQYTNAAIKYLFPRNCTTVLFAEMDFFKSNCAKIALTRLFSVMVTAASTLVYFPQFAKILNTRSAQGISYLSVFLGMLASAGTAAYGFHRGTTFSKYGDSVFLFIQQMLLFTLILHYSSHSPFAFAFIAACWATMFAVIGSYVPPVILKAIFKYAIHLAILSKLVQGRHNFRHKSTGQLSLTSTFLVVFADLARCMTKRNEPLDMITLRGLSIAMSLVLLWQFRIYRQKPLLRPGPAVDHPLKKTRNRRKSE